MALSFFKAEDFSTEQLYENFFSYFGSGELSLLTFSVLGSAFWCWLTKEFSSRKKAIVLSLVVISLLFTCLQLGENPSFEDGLTPKRHLILWAMYCFALTAWFFSMTSESEVTYSDSAQESDKLLQKAKQ